jgi:hypothetical protein
MSVCCFVLTTKFSIDNAKLAGAQLNTKKTVTQFHVSIDLEGNLANPKNAMRQL